MTAPPANSRASSRVCTTDVSWYSSSSTTRCLLRSTCTTSGAAAVISSARDTWSLYWTAPIARFAARNAVASRSSTGSVRAGSIASSTSPCSAYRPPYGSASIAAPYAARHRGDRVGVGRVLAETVRDIEHELGDPVDAEVELRQPGVVRLDHDASGELPGGGLAEHDAVRVAPDPHGVVPVEPVREGVVGRHDGRVERVVVLREADPREHREALADPLGQLGGGLAGERQAEDLGSVHPPVREQPEHPHRHRLGLAAARARDDERRPERRLDDRPLLRGRRGLPQALGDLERGDEAAPDASATAHVRHPQQHRPVRARPEPDLGLDRAGERRRRPCPRRRRRAAAGTRPPPRRRAGAA